jgi:hypothetical protein
MTTRGNKKKPAAKRKGKRGNPKKRVTVLLRQWSLPLVLLVFVCFSLAAAFYLIFLHTPATPVF